MKVSNHTQEQLDNLLYFSPAIIFKFNDLEPGTSYISPNVKRILGHEVEDFIDNPTFFRDHIHPDDQEKALANYPELYKTGQWCREYRFKHKNGSYRWMMDELKVVYSDDGKPLEIVGSWLDVTKQVKEREALQQLQQLSKEYINRAPTLFMILDEDGIIQDINPSTEHLLGYTRDKMIGKSWFQNFLPVDVRVEREWLFRSWMLAGKATEKTFDGKILTAEGKVYIIQWRTVIVKGPNGHFHMVLAGEEMTDSILAQQELKESEELYRLMALNTTDLIQKNDAEWRFTYLSPSCETLTGYLPAELLGRSIYDYLHPDDISAIQQGHMQAMMGMQENLTVTYRFKTKSGKYLWLESNSHTVYNDKDELKEVVSVARDITQRKRMEQELEEMGQLMIGIHEKLSVISFRVDTNGNIKKPFGKGLQKLGPEENSPLKKNVFESFPQLVEYLKPGTWKNYFTVETSGENNHKPWWFQHFYFKDKNHENELIGFAFDITDLKRTQNELLKTKEMYRILVNSFPDVSVYVFDQHLRFQFAEGQALATKNLKSEDLVGKTLPSLLGPDHPLNMPYKNIFKGIAKVFEMEAEGRTFLIDVTPLKDTTGKIVSGIAISHDITEKKKLEQTILNVAITGNDMQRKEFSEKLHDGLGQKIASIKLKLEQIDESILATDPLQQESLVLAKKTINLVLKNLRELSNIMMPTILTDFGLLPALEELFSTVNIRSKLKINFETPSAGLRRNLDIEMGLYRIVQDMVAALERNEQPLDLLVQLYEGPNKLILRAEQTDTVDNNNIDSFENTREFINITSRARALNGRLVVKTLSDKRLLITLEIPFAL